jgi:hypothetical protein
MQKLLSPSSAYSNNKRTIDLRLFILAPWLLSFAVYHTIVKVKWRRRAFCAFQKNNNFV